MPPPDLGLCQWFHFQDKPAVRRCIGYLHDLGVRHLRTGVSWADFHRPGGPAWTKWLLEALAEFDILLSVWHTPPSLSENGRCSGPPRRLQDYADFIDLLIERHGHCFSELELWNEPNNRLKWDFPRCDPQWEKFAVMVGMAGHWARQCGKPTVLGGMIPIDPHWLKLMADRGVLRCVDVVAIHGFPEMWWDHAPNWDWYHHWTGWRQKIAAFLPHARGLPLWITETGLATWDLPRGRPGREDLQCRMLRRAAAAPVQRVYWYCLMDLHPDRTAIEGYHVDENEYHLGLLTHDGRKKPAYELFKRLRTRRDRSDLATIETSAF